MSCSVRFLRAMRFGIVALVAASAPAGAERLPIRSFTTEEGFPSDYVNNIVCDSQGFLWFLGRDGVARYDGHFFTLLGPEQGLPKAWAADLLETRKGDLLLAVGDGVFWLDPDSTSSRLRFVRAKGGGEDEDTQTLALFEDRSGRIWCGANFGFYRVVRDDQGWSLQAVDLGQALQQPRYHVVAIGEARDGALWIGVADAGALVRLLPDGSSEVYGMDAGLPTKDIRSLLVDSGGVVWVGTREGLCRVVEHPRPGEDVVAHVYTEADGLGGRWIWDLFEDSRGTLWVATDKGLGEYRRDARAGQPRFRSYSLAHGLSDPKIVAVEEDAEGNLWLATSTAGVLKLARDGLTTFTMEDGIEEDPAVVALFEDRRGRLCGVTGFGGLVINCFVDGRFNAVRPNVVATDRGWGWHQVHFQDTRGFWWVPTFEGLYRFPQGASFRDLAYSTPDRVYDSHNGLPQEYVFRLFEDRRGDIWLSTLPAEEKVPPDPALYRWQRSTEQFYAYSAEQGVPLDPPTMFVEDGTGALWVGFYRAGFGRFRGGRFQNLSEEDGAPKGFVSDFCLDASGRLWVSMPKYGVLRIDDPSADPISFRLYTTETGLTSNYVRCITEDSMGRLYFGSIRGVDRLDPESGDVRNYSTTDGLASSHVVVAHRTPDGALWFGTTLGASRLIPRPDRPSQPPPVWIRSLRVAGEPRHVPELGTMSISRFELGPDRRQVEIEFSSLSFRTGERMRFQHRFAARDARWSEPTVDRSVNFANLAPGRYRFEVRAVSSGGLVSPEPAVVAFRILPPVWRRWWFVALCAGLIAATATAFHRSRLRRVVQLERLRTRIASDLHDDIGTSLSQVALLSEVARSQVDGATPEAAKPLLGKIADTSREILDAMSDVVWAINPERDRVSDLVHRIHRFASETFTARRVAYRFSAPQGDRDLKLNVDTRRQVYLICKEAVVNAVRHSGCSEAALEFHVDGDFLVFSLADNGRGFDVGASHQGHGLVSMQRRASAVGGQLDLMSRPDEGTTIRLRQPLRPQSALLNVWRPFTRRDR